MKQCIFCMNSKEDSEFNREHIILEALGGKGDEDICFNVCTSCNSSLGTRVDASLLNQSVTKYMRYILGIKGKTGIPNPFKGIELTYADTPFIGELKVNKEGEISGFRAKHKIYKSKGNTIIVGPRKGFPAYVNSQLKQMGFSQLAEEEIWKGRIDLGETKVPHIECINIPEEMKEQYLIFAFPTMLKMAYEYCFVTLGENYLSDSLAIQIRDFLMKFDYKKDFEYFSPTEASLEWRDGKERIVSLKIYRNDSKVFVTIVLWGMVIATICMSESGEKYKKDLNSILTIVI